MTLAELLVELSRQGIRLEADGDRLLYYPSFRVTSELVQRMKDHKGELLTRVRLKHAPVAEASQKGGDDSLIERTDPRKVTDADVVDCIEPPEPCSTCGSLMAWWNFLGQLRCMKCDPPIIAIKTLENVERIRRRHGLTSSPGATSMLRDLKALTSRHYADPRHNRR